VSLDPAERFARLRLARTDRIGPVAFAQLIGRYGSALSALDALPDLVRKSGAASVPAPVETVEREMAAGDAIGARLLVLGDADYPEMLAALDPPPPILWTRGRADLLNQPSVAIVGARIASAGGQRIARGLAQQLGQAGHVVVSGMARGIDAAAHEGALATGTVAVLGGGVNDIYPSEHADLYARLTDQGCVVSESPVGARAQARDFPRRNRIISGLSPVSPPNRAAMSSPCPARRWIPARAAQTNCCVRARSCARGSRTSTAPSTPCALCVSLRQIPSVSTATSTTPSSTASPPCCRRLRRRATRSPAP
jgi:DNA processing protein